MMQDELERAKAKRDKWQKRIDTLEQRIREERDTENVINKIWHIVSVVEGLKIHDRKPAVHLVIEKLYGHRNFGLSLLDRERVNMIDEDMEIIDENGD